MRAAEAVIRVAAAAGMLPATVDRAFRTLQLPKDDHAPVGWVGSGKQAPHMQLHHLRFLGLGITALPISTAVEWVDLLCSFRLSHIVKDFGNYTFPNTEEELPLINGVLIARNFGAAFDRLIEQATTPDGKVRTSRVTVEVTLHGERPSARIWALNDNRERFDAVYQAPLQELPAASERQAPGLVRTAAIRSPIIHTLADIWSDTLRRASPTPSLPGIATPGSESADAPARASAQSDGHHEPGKTERTPPRTAEGLETLRNSNAGVCVRSSSVWRGGRPVARSPRYADLAQLEPAL